ncbi:hypothetical protein [Paraburkholderia sp. MM5477-R1]|uniref:hypothetical protein n=1 Tax=Paraburkholderia sp. MM5477-R1 TaxID=2991062 RepID=UPI003D20F67B
MSINVDLFAFAMRRSGVRSSSSHHKLFCIEKHLQNFGGVTDPFLYVRSTRGGITLRHGVAYSLRRFYTLLQQMSRTRWVEHIKANRRNHAILGDADDLADFLFCAELTSRVVYEHFDGGRFQAASFC